MKIKLLKSCMLNGESKKVGFVGDVPTKTAKMLIGMGKAESLETETVELKMSVDVSPELDEKIKELEAKFEKVLTEKDEVIEELKETIEISKTEAQKEIAELRKELDEQDALIAKMEQDIKNLTLKELREKYPAVVVETE